MFARRLSLRSGCIRSLCALPAFRPLSLHALPQSNRKCPCKQPVCVARPLPVDFGRGRNRSLRFAYGQKLRDDLLPPMRVPTAAPYPERSGAGGACWVARHRALRSTERAHLLRLGPLLELYGRPIASFRQIPGVVARVTGRRRERGSGDGACVYDRDCAGDTSRRGPPDRLRSSLRIKKVARRARAADDVYRVTSLHSPAPQLAE